MHNKALTVLAPALYYIYVVFSSSFKSSIINVPPVIFTMEDADSKKVGRRDTLEGYRAALLNLARLQGYIAPSPPLFW